MKRGTKVFLFMMYTVCMLIFGVSIYIYGYDQGYTSMIEIANDELKRADEELKQLNNDLEQLNNKMTRAIDDNNQTITELIENSRVMDSIIKDYEQHSIGLLENPDYSYKTY